MTGPEFRATRRALGLTINGLCDAMAVGEHHGPNERTVRRWETGAWPIPGMAVLAILSLVSHDKNN